MPPDVGGGIRTGPVTAQGCVCGDGSTGCDGCGGGGSGGGLIVVVVEHAG